MEIMKAQVLEEVGKPLIFKEVEKPTPKDNEVLIRVKACGVCRTDLHILDGELKTPSLPLILGHEVVGVIEEMGKNVKGFKKGDRVGAFWLSSTCFTCEYCKDSRENLCDKAKFRGYLSPGGYAEYTTAISDFIVPLPKTLSDLEIAPLLCAGLIGYRSYRKANPKKRIGFYGFGAAAHLLIQIALHEKKEVYAFTRPQDKKGQQFAKKLGAVWAGGSDEIPPELLDAVIIFAPVGELVSQSLKVLKKGGRSILGGIHMSDIPSFPYKDLWGEKRIESVANLTRQDAKEYFELLEKVTIRANVTAYPLEKANEALRDFKQGNIQGAAVLNISSD